MALWPFLCLFPFPFHVLNWLSVSGGEQLLYDLEDKSRVLTMAEQKDKVKIRRFGIFSLTTGSPEGRGAGD